MVWYTGWTVWVIQKGVIWGRCAVSQIWVIWYLWSSALQNGNCNANNCILSTLYNRVSFIMSAVEVVCNFTSSFFHSWLYSFARALLNSIKVYLLFWCWLSCVVLTKRLFGRCYHLFIYLFFLLLYLDVCVLYITDVLTPYTSSVLWHCWLGGRKSVWPVKKLSNGMLVWLSVWSKVQMICIWSN